KRSGRFLAEALPDLPANISVGLLGLVRRGVASRANGPDRLIRDDESAHRRGVQAVQAGQLGFQHALGLVRLSLGQRFTDAKDYAQSGCQRSLDLPIDKGIAFAEDVPPFTVSEDDPVTA